MASVFTFEPDPPRMASPWLHIGDPSPSGRSANGNGLPEPTQNPQLDGRGITKLQAEPQEGPVEYKLHLLLRPRRRLSSSSTVLQVSGSHQSKSRLTNRAHGSSDTQPLVASIPVPTSQTRNNRLQNLTTQLLWRLQQSSPFHSSAKTELVVPTFLESKNDALAPTEPRIPLPGLEESQGALYEIGVSDDGTLVGLTEDELQESLDTLSIMASSLGCRVDVLRRIIVGTCQWTDKTQSSSQAIRTLRKESLWVAEAQVAPNLSIRKETPLNKITGFDSRFSSGLRVDSHRHLETDGDLHNEQLRVSLTGSTTSGKSSLLGTLSTSTLDNGRGKSRLSLLKHRHEIASGVTSSIVTELIGYNENIALPTVDVINFAFGNISSWTDIHSACELNRLVVLTDSAGHPRYRRTTVRGLLSWAPHWTICCVAADDDEHDTGKTGATATSVEILGSQGADVDLSRSHLELCLALGLPLIIVITKLDLASSSGLRETLRKVLTILKAAQRQPVVLSSSASPNDSHDLQAIPNNDRLEIAEVVAKIQHSGSSTLVPIVLTSAVTGIGICKLHALLHRLPVLTATDDAGKCPTAVHDVSGPSSIFNVDEVFTTSQESSVAILDGSKIVDGHILSGHLSRGTIQIGDTMLIGPFTSDLCTDWSDEHKLRLARSCPTFKESRSVSRMSNDQYRYSSGLCAGSESPSNEAISRIPVWRMMRIVSLRNLRLPVRQLLEGQVGTIGVTYDHPEKHRSSERKTEMLPGGRLRKGMVLVQGPTPFRRDPPQPYRRFSAVFEDGRVASITPGSSVIVYIASIRASAKVISVRGSVEPHMRDEIFQLDDAEDSILNDAGSARDQVQISFEFLASVEWFEPGSQVLVMPERADAGSVGLKGFVGKTKDPD